MAETRKLSEEQIKKMQEGRRLAFEKRKAEKERAKKDKEVEKEIARLEKLQKKVALEKAIEDQKRRKEEQVKAYESRQAKKEKLHNIKMKVDDVEISYPADEIEEEVESEDDTMEMTEEEFKEIYNEKVIKIEKSLPVKARKMFRDATGKYDYNINLQENIERMIKGIEEIVNHNARLSNTVKEKIVEDIKPNKVETISNEQIKSEEQVNQMIYGLMKNSGKKKGRGRY